MMKEAYERDRWIDKVSIARELRGLAQGVWFYAATGEVAEVTYGWDTDTCVDQYDELDPIGRLGVRTAPTFLGTALAFFAAQFPLHWPQSRLMWVAVAYLIGMWALLTFYDPVAGLWSVVRERPGSRGVSA